MVCRLGIWFVAELSQGGPGISKGSCKALPSCVKLKRNAPYPAFEGFRGKGYLSRLSWSFSANRGEPTGEEGERDLVRASGNPSPNALMLLRRILRKREVLAS
jgi:hypothetical protein